MLPKESEIVVAKFGSSPRAAANSFKVSNVPGAELTRFAISELTKLVVAYPSIVPVIVRLPAVIFPLVVILDEEELLKRGSPPTVSTFPEIPIATPPI